VSGETLPDVDSPGLNTVLIDQGLLATTLLVQTALDGSAQS
jgi:hypothetical protein